MAFFDVEYGNIDAVDTLVDKVEITEMVEVDSHFRNSSQCHLNINRKRQR